MIRIEFTEDKQVSLVLPYGGKEVHATMPRATAIELGQLLIAAGSLTDKELLARVNADPYRATMMRELERLEKLQGKTD
jgi:hypothetical protein